MIQRGCLLKSGHRFDRWSMTAMAIYRHLFAIVSEPISLISSLGGKLRVGRCERLR
jgi:hypothetical protein